jgi:hypothetical protein
MLEVKANPSDAARHQMDIDSENFGLDSWLMSSWRTLIVVCLIFNSGSEAFIH